MALNEETLWAEQKAVFTKEWTWTDPDGPVDTTGFEARFTVRHGPEMAALIDLTESATTGISRVYFDTGGVVGVHITPADMDLPAQSGLYELRLWPNGGEELVFSRGRFSIRSAIAVG